MTTSKALRTVVRYGARLLPGDSYSPARTVVATYGYGGRFGWTTLDISRQLIDDEGFDVWAFVRAQVITRLRMDDKAVEPVIDIADEGNRLASDTTDGDPAPTDPLGFTIAVARVMYADKGLSEKSALEIVTDQVVVATIKKSHLPNSYRPRDVFDIAELTTSERIALDWLPFPRLPPGCIGAYPCGYGWATDCLVVCTGWGHGDYGADGVTYPGTH